MTFDLPFALTMLMRLSIAALLGGVIGLERERARRNAGLRTHILLCLGAALVMCTGEFIFAAHSNQASMDPARLGAQVVSGIGILCAGTIMKEGSTIRGLTTATGLWCASCIGLAAGSGNLIPAVGATVIVVIVLWFFRNLEEKRLHKNNYLELSILLQNTQGIVENIMNWMRINGYAVRSLTFEQLENGDVLLFCGITMPKGRTDADLVAGLSFIKDIKRVERLPQERSS
ncbi:MAG: MgtC/SapB family protein [Candidatus Pelethousia sp.]|nr:MgtC/SapB family protein [Candidatus Pelethousia sp.]